MAAVIFNGKAFAGGIVTDLRTEVVSGGRKIKMVTIVNRENEAAMTYTRIKKKMAESLGIEFESFELADFERAKRVIELANEDERVTGVMVQLPFLDKRLDEKLCGLIQPEKDVDGLNSSSGVVPATTLAVTEIVEVGLEKIGRSENKKRLMVVVGFKGNVGRSVVKAYENDERFEVVGLDLGQMRAEELKEAEVVISATGEAGLIDKEMIKPGVLVVDVGFPGGDFKEDVAEVAGFMTPVPGGVGPVTVVMLFKNLIELGRKR